MSFNPHILDQTALRSFPQSRRIISDTVSVTEGRLYQQYKLKMQNTGITLKLHHYLTLYTKHIQ